MPRSELEGQGELRLGLRPESVRVATGAKVTTKAKVELVERLGERTLVYARLSDGQADHRRGRRQQPGQDRRSRSESGSTASASHIFGADGSSHHARAGS